MQGSKLVFISACAGMLLFGISVITLGSLAPNLNVKFHLDPIASGTLFSILPFGILTGSLVFGPFSDRYGYKFFLVLSALCMFGGFQGIAFAPSLLLLKFCVFLFGFGGGAINGATNAVVADISSSNKGANLSLLGIFYALGALGMPGLLGFLENRFSYETILSYVSLASLLIAGLFIFTRFPAAKQVEGIPISKAWKLTKEGFILLSAFFLFFQSSFEAIINNWTTTYLSQQLAIPGNRALFALSLYVVGMAAMRLIIGSLLRNITSQNILFLCLTFLVIGCLFIHFASSYFVSAIGMVAIGIGLAAGFPIVMGLIGIRYESLSATAFSIVLFIALSGNMMLNYLMGIVVEKFGIQQFPAVLFTLCGAMLLLAALVIKKYKSFTSN
ncbi:MAG TPA: MFS transporter [Cyclobacteriaceae bacterium]|nr:MFS transporter [Cyclobacteriaceae bacterium]